MTVAAPNTRVLAFIADYARAWSAAVPVFAAQDPACFDKWNEALAALREGHFTASGIGLEGGSFSSGAPAHHPDHERIVGIRADVEPDTTLVETATAGALEQFHEYRLVRVGADWRIASLESFYDASDKPVLSADEAAPLFAAINDDAPFAPLPPGEEPNCDVLFVPHRTVTIQQDTTTTSVQTLDGLVIESGLFGACDFGYGGSGFAPLARTVPRGRHPVDVVTVLDRTAAFRVRFSSAQTVAWHPANTTRGSSTIGVDAGNVAAFDARSFANGNARAQSRLFDRWSRAGWHGARETNRSVLLSLVHNHDVFLTESGWGDGGYASYWGVDADGKLVSFVVDFALLGEAITEQPTLIVRHGIATLIPRGGSLSLEDDDLVVRGNRNDVQANEITDASGTLLVDLTRCGMSVSNGERRYHLESTKRPAELHVTLTIYVGYRNR